MRSKKLYLYTSYNFILRGTRKSNDAQKSKENPRSEKDPYLCDCKKILSYYSSVRGKFIKEVLKKLGLNDSIFEITDLDVLEMVRKEVAKKEKRWDDTTNMLVLLVNLNTMRYIN